MNIRYESESGITFDNPTDEDLDHLLAQLDGVDNSYASLTRLDGSYLQTGGGPTTFTVEERRTRPGGMFCHLKAFHAGRGSEARSIVVGGARVSVRADQLLDLPTVQEIFRSFRRGIPTPPKVIWKDITAMFDPS